MTDNYEPFRKQIERLEELIKINEQKLEEANRLLRGDSVKQIALTLAELVEDDGDSYMLGAILRKWRVSLNDQEVLEELKKLL